MTPEEALLRHMARPGYEPTRLEDLARAIGADREAYQRLRKAVPQLVRSGALVVVARDKLALPPQGSHPEGTIPQQHNVLVKLIAPRGAKHNMAALGKFRKQKTYP